MRIESRARRYRLPRLPDWLREVLAEAPALPSQLLGIGVLLVMVASEAGYGDTNWPPAALLMLGLLAVTAVVVGLPRRPGALQLAGLALFAGYAAWSFLSITWAGVAADAWEAAERTSGYLVVIALFLLWPPGPRGVRLLLAAFSLGVAAVGVVELLRADASATPGGFFIDVRFAEPAGYINANVAMWTLGLFGCVATAAFPRAHPALRGSGAGRRHAARRPGPARPEPRLGVCPPAGSPRPARHLPRPAANRARVDPHRRRAAADPPDAARRPRRVQPRPPRRPAVRRHRGPDARHGDRRRRGRPLGLRRAARPRPTRAHAGDSPAPPARCSWRWRWARRWSLSPRSTTPAAS